MMNYANVNFRDLISMGAAAFFTISDCKSIVGSLQKPRFYNTYLPKVSIIQTAMKKMLMSAWLRAFNQDSRGQMKCGGTIEWHSATSESGYLQPELQRSPSGGICLYQCPTWRDRSSALPKSNSRETMQLINPRHTIIPQPPSRQSTFGLQLPCSHPLGKKNVCKIVRQSYVDLMLLCTHALFLQHVYSILPE